MFSNFIKLTNYTSIIQFVNPSFKIIYASYDTDIKK